jgi:hypothetical protein
LRIDRGDRAGFPKVEGPNESKQEDAPSLGMIWALEAAGTDMPA